MFGKGMVAGMMAIAMALAGCIGIPAQPDAAALDRAAASFAGVAPMRLEDPQGDASASGAGCLVGALLGADCITVPGADGVAEHLDIVSVALEQESADELVLTLGIARLEEGFRALAAPEGVHRITQFGVCWYDEEGDCTRAAFLSVMRHGEMAHADARFEAYSEECNRWSWCAWTIPLDVRFGAPAEIVFRVPKEYAVLADGPLAAHHFDAWTSWSDQATAFPMWHGGVTASTPARHFHTHTPTPGAFGTGDITAPLDAGVEFAEPATARAPALGAPLASGYGGATHAHGSAYDHPELDLVGFDLYEEEGGLAVLFALEHADAQPSFDFDYSIALGLRAGPALEIGFRQERGEAVGYAGECIMEECQDAERFEVPAEFIAGAPAFVIVHVPAEAWQVLAPDVEAGDETTLVWASTMVTEGSQYVGEYEDALWGDVHHAFMADEIIGGAPFVFGSGHRAPLSAFEVGHAH